MNVRIPSTSLPTNMPWAIVAVSGISGGGGDVDISRETVATKLAANICTD